MSDDFKKASFKDVACGGIECPCCSFTACKDGSKKHGKKHQKLRQICRRRLTEEDRIRIMEEIGFNDPDIQAEAVKQLTEEIDNELMEFLKNAMDKDSRKKRKK